eukprot:NODE_399_length_9361_cov_0.420428.p5 type:complete len:111 gc:universal NODE_399_length_9361_cov_0.420428:9230-8898(-)
MTLLIHLISGVPTYWLLQSAPAWIQTQININTCRCLYHWNFNMFINNADYCIEVLEYLDEIDYQSKSLLKVHHYFKHNKPAMQVNDEIGPVMPVCPDSNLKYGRTQQTKS